MYSIDLLVAEHENVIRLCNVIRNACLAALESKSVKTEDFRSFLRIIREYADKHHHGKEELLLFKEMEGLLGVPAQKLVRNGMLVEHDLGRLYASQLEEAIDRREKSGCLGSLLDIIVNSMSYVDLLKRHIDKENNVVYTFAQRNLPEQVLADLDKKTKDFEKGKDDFLASILSLLDQLEKSYAV